VDSERTEFRRARPEEAQQLTELALASKRYWGHSESLIELWREDLEFTPELIRAQTVIVAEEERGLVGVAAVSPSGDSAELPLRESEHRELAW
jgi:hypothetical protein